MAKTIHPVRVNHLNVVLEDFQGSIAHLNKVFGAEMLNDLGGKDWHACLIDIGDVIFEIFTPFNFFLNTRYGPHYLGIEYSVPSMPEAREVVAAHNVRIARDIVAAIHTHPADGFGSSFEFWDGVFHGNDKLTGGPMKGPAYWRDQHPLGLTGLKAHTHAVEDIDKATKFLGTFLDAKPAYDAARPDIDARARGFHIGDAILELVTPEGDGVLRRHLNRHGEGIRSTIFGVRDMGQARRHFAGLGVPLVAGTIPGSVAVPAEANLGLTFEFAE